MNIRLPHEGMGTPWGAADYVERTIEGIWQVHTPSHGGIWLSPQRNADVPAYMRRADRWYEEDCDWAIVYVVFEADLLKNATDPYTLKEIETGHHKQTLMNWRPDEYEAFFQVQIKEGESYTRRGGTLHKRMSLA